MYLVDTNSISEARRKTPEAVNWLRSVDPAQVYLSVITLGQIMHGITLKQKSDPRAAGHLAE
jgi:predicted nucleic acid-binding protein